MEESNEYNEDLTKALMRVAVAARGCKGINSTLSEDEQIQWCAVGARERARAMGLSIELGQEVTKASRDEAARRLKVLAEADKKVNAAEAEASLHGFWIELDGSFEKAKQKGEDLIPPLEVPRPALFGAESRMAAFGVAALGGFLLAWKLKEAMS